MAAQKTDEHTLLDERSVVDMHRCHMAAKFVVFVLRIMFSTTSNELRVRCPTQNHAFTILLILSSLYLLSL